MSLSVVIPNYNGARTLLDTLASVLDQVTEFTEVVIIDDHSTDNSVQLVKSAYPLVRVYEQPTNSGAAATRNRGLSVTRGDWILFLDADVTLQSNCLIDLLDASDDADIIFPTILYPNGELMYPIDEKQARYLLISPVFLLRRAPLVQLTIPKFDEIYNTYCEDTDFFLRAFLVGLRSKHVPDAKAVHNVNLQPGDRDARYFMEVRNAIYGAIKFRGIPAINAFDHAFKIANILRVLVCGCFNFNLFDMQARGYHKQSGFYQNIVLLFGKRNRLTSRGRRHLIGLSIKAVFWNMHHLSLALGARSSIRVRLNEID